MDILKDMATQILKTPNLSVRDIDEIIETTTSGAIGTVARPLGARPLGMMLPRRTRKDWYQLITRPAPDAPWAV